MRAVMRAGSIALLLVCGGAVAAQERVDLAMLERIRAEARDRSRVVETFQYLVTTIGPRLTNSPAHKRAVAWAEATLRAWGMSGVEAEPFEFGRGWTLTKVSVELIAPRYMPLIGYAKGWSPPTAGRLEGAPLWVPGLDASALAARRAALDGAILMTSPVQEYLIRADRPPASGDLKGPQPAPARPPQMTAERLAALKAAGVAVTLEPSLGEHGTVFVTGRDMGANAVPAVVLAAEHYNLVARLLDRGETVRLAVEVQAAYDAADTRARNVVFEIPGVDAGVKDEIVMAGAHLDSWHTSDGATDNADGVATVMEAMRILQALGVRPRRTIRAALWAGEEQGLLGSRAYVRRHLAGEANRAARDAFSVYFNLDNGFPPISGFYMEGNEPARRIVEAWLGPLADLGATVAAPGGIGATDHLSFIAEGLPGFQVVQSYAGYDTRTHHTNVDAAERVEPEALRQASIVMASVLYHAAMREGAFPRAEPLRRP